MLSETILLPKSIKEAEDRFIIKLKEQLLSMIKEINRLEKRIASIKEFTGLEDLLKAIKGKANADASNVGKNADVDTTLQWGRALGTGDIIEYNEKLVTGGTMHTELRPPGTVTAYNYVAPTFTTAENLISLDAKIKEVDDELKAIVFPEWDTSHLAKIDLSNIDWQGEQKINGIARASIEIKPYDMNLRFFKVMEGKTETYYLGLNSGSSGLGKVYAEIDASNVGANHTSVDGTENRDDWEGALGIPVGQAWTGETSFDDGLIGSHLFYNDLYKDIPVSGHYISNSKTVGKNIKDLDDRVHQDNVNIATNTNHITTLNTIVGSNDEPKSGLCLDVSTLKTDVNNLTQLIGEPYVDANNQGSGILKEIGIFKNERIGNWTYYPETIASVIGDWRGYIHNGSIAYNYYLLQDRVYNTLSTNHVRPTNNALQPWNTLTDELIDIWQKLNDIVMGLARYNIEIYPPDNNNNSGNEGGSEGGSGSGNGD